MKMALVSRPGLLSRSGLELLGENDEALADEVFMIFA
jgi:hypothetical protein